jgi:multidrug transporter EmrE-like cation transporter
VVGVVFFQETLRTREVVGILLGVASLVLLTE